MNPAGHSKPKDGSSSKPYSSASSGSAQYTSADYSYFSPHAPLTSPSSAPNLSYNAYSANVILTILISVQLLVFRRRIMKHQSAEHGRDYFSLLTIIVESAALYSAFGIIFIVTYALNNPLNQIFLFVANSSQQIASYLIIFRVARGSAWSRRTFARQEGIQSQALQFKQPRDSSAGEYSIHGPTVTTGSVIPENTPAMKLELLNQPTVSHFGVGDGNKIRTEDSDE